MLNGLCATWANTAVDIIVIVVLAIFAIVGARKGFVDCFFGFISTIVAIILAFSLAQPMLGWTGGLFGLQGVLEQACINAFAGVKGFALDVSNEGLTAMLAEQNLPQFLVDMVVSGVGNSEIPAGTTLAMLVGQPLGELATTLIVGILLFILSKLLLSLLKNIISGIVRRLPIIGTVNGLLGLVVGALQGLLIVSGVIAVLGVLPVDGMALFFNECAVLGWLYNQNFINVILGWILV